MIGPGDHLGVCASPIVKCQIPGTDLIPACHDRKFSRCDQKTDFLRRRLVGDECGGTTLVAHQACTSQPVDSFAVWRRVRGRQLKVEWGFACKPSRDYLGRVGATLEWQGSVQVISVNLGSGLYVVHGAYSLDGLWNEDQT